MSRAQQQLRWLAVTVMIMGTAWGGVLGGGPASAQPDYTNVTDILNGRRHLLRTDDLVIAYQVGTGTERTSLGSVLLTETSTAIGQMPTSLSSSFSESVPTVLGARLFDTPYDVAVSAVSTGLGLQWFLDADIGRIAEGALFSSFGLPGLFSAAYDFTGDGYDDLIFFTTDDVSSGDGPLVVAATAVDPANPGQGLKFGGWFNFGVGHAHTLAIATGNIAGTLRVFSLGHTEAVDPPCQFGNDLAIETYIVDPQSLAVIAIRTDMVNIPEGDAACGQSAAIAVGRFGNTAHDQLAVAYAVQGGTVKVIPIDLDDQGNPAPKPPFDTQTPVGIGRAWIRSGQFDWSNPFDQAALLISSGQENSLRILTFTESLNVQQGPVGTFPANICVGDMAVGNFDRMQANTLPPPAPAMVRNPNLQVAAFLQLQCGGTNFAVQIWDVDPVPNSPGEFQLGQDHVSFFSSLSAGGIPTQTMAMAAADIQGRSYRLGRGHKITIQDYTQPSAITAMPPMHVDFVTPSGSTSPTVLNLSALPDSFTTQYVIESVNNTDTTNTDTVSHSFGFKETVGASFEVGDYDEGEGTQFEDTVTATQDIKSATEKAHGTFESQSETIATTTGWGDSVAYTTSTFNIWVYEVLGQEVCPQGKPNCQESDKRPLTVQFSAPFTTAAISKVGPLIEWYQPPWEPGNVFSYPANYAQLQQSVPGAIDKLTTDHTYFTDSQSVVQSTQWRSGVSSSTTIGTDKTFSGDNNLSVAGKGGISDLYTVGFQVGFEAYGSDAFSNNTQTHGESNQSTGMTFNKPGTFAEQSLYAYAFTPYIFGTMQPPNFVDTVDLNTQVTTFGPLRSAFVADPTAPGSGGWWSQTYTVPDVALNHPTRWTVSQAELPGPSTPIPANCLPFGSDSSKMDCVTLNQATPNNPWSSAVHFMRGFFISSAANPGAGPQREMAVEGEKLSLQARVYNYSLTPMSDNVHVRFYGVPWNQGTNMPAGNAFLIGEDVLGPIPAFDASHNTPNWVLASTTWDTSNHGDQFFTFFVLTWMQQGDGSLAAEMPGHGLTGIPGTINAFSDAAKLEEIVSGQTVSYSNNLGFYNHAFYVLAQGSSELEELTQNDPGDVRLGRIKLSQSKVASGQSLEVSALLRAHKQSASGVSVVFYHGDPQNGGTAFDVERIAHIRAHDASEARVLFRSDVCGEHRIYITVGKGKPYEVTEASRPFTVQCR